MDGLILSHEQLERMRRHVDSLAPLEACGLLSGLLSQAGELVRVAEVLPVRNIAQSSTRFRMDPVEQIQAFDWMEEQGQQLAGIYHSHPQGPPHPSSTDLEEAAYDVVYIIWSRPEGSWQPRSYRIIDKQVQEAALIMLDA